MNDPDEALLSLLGKRYIERRDVKAIQQPNGIYIPDRTPLTMRDLRDHVSGVRTLGHYLISRENLCRIFVFDLDVTTGPIVWEGPDGEEALNPRLVIADPTHWARPILIHHLNMLAEVLARRTSKYSECPVAAHFSGSKGIHVTCFTGSIPATEARDAAIAILDESCELVKGKNFYREPGFEAIEIELFPKQATLEGKDLGNLLRLPLGVNRKSRQRSFFLNFKFPADEFTEFDPMIALGRGMSWT